MQYIINLFNHYGYIVLLIALMLELIALPLPGEALMIYCGYLIYTQKMSWSISILVATLGVIIGITVSYFIGKVLGLDFFEKHGRYIHMDKNRLDKIAIWAEKYGNKLLLIAYFIPGVRHVTGYFSGMTKVPYKKFAISAYIGAFIWTTTFISLGKVLGSNWEKYHTLLKKYLVIASVIIAFIIIAIYIYKAYRKNIYNFLLKVLNNSLNIFHSMGRIKALIAGVAVLFLIFSALIIGIIQDYLANEFSQFDEIVEYIILHIFDEDWNNSMKLFSNISNIYVLLIIISLTAIWITIKGTNKVHEVKFMIISFSGAVLLELILRNVFHRIGPTGIQYTFPSSKVLMSVVVYGFLAYIVVRHSRKTWINSIIIGLWLSSFLLTGLSMVYFNLQYPSDVVAGFEFGMVWITLVIILLEVYRVLPKITYQER